MCIGYMPKLSKYIVPDVEKDESPISPTIYYNVYTYQGKCSKHGTIADGPQKCPHCLQEKNEIKDSSKLPTYGRKKHLTKMHTLIGEFHQKYYGPILKKCAYHFF